MECPPHAFRCANDQCVSFNEVCDGMPDCQDGSDEMTICKGNKFRSTTSFFNISNTIYLDWSVQTNSICCQYFFKFSQAFVLLTHFVARTETVLLHYLLVMETTTVGMEVTKWLRIVNTVFL